MNPSQPPASGNASKEILALIKTLHQTGRQLEELTAGEVDTVAVRNGQALLLPSSQEHFRRSEAAKQAAILNALPATIALLDAQGTILSVNEGWRRFANENALRAQDFGIGLNYFSVCDRVRGHEAAEARQAAAGLRSVLDGGVDSFSFEYPCHSPEEQRWFLMTATPMAEDRPCGAVVMHLDVTARRLADEGMRESELKFHQMAENIQDAFFLLDAEGWRMVYVSPAFESIWGRTREELYENPEIWIQAMHPEDRASAFETYTQALLTGKAEFEFRVVHPDSSIRWVEVRAFPVLDDAGTIMRITGIAKDITVRRQAEETLRWSETQLHVTLEATADGILAVNNAGKVITANHRFMELWRIPPSLMEGHDDEAMLAFVLDQLSEPEAFLNKVQALYGSDAVDMDLLAFKDGRMFERYSAPMLIKGSVTGRVWSFRDITERKEAQDRIIYLNRIYAVLSGINTLIVRVNDRDELFRETCRIAVEIGGFRMAFIAMVDPSTLQAVPTASAGEDAALMKAIEGLLSSSEYAPGTMAARAIKERLVLVSIDSRNDPQVLLRDRYAESGVRSIAAFPILVSEEAVGVLTLYAAEPGFFQEEELKVLTGLTRDIAFAIDHLGKQARLNYLAYYDVLTGLANRSLFLERLAQHMHSAAAAGHKLALFLADLERFKNINDSLGRPAGDELLRQVAAWLTHITGDASLVARVGSDHFAVVLPDIKPEGDLTRLIEGMLQVFLDHPFRLNDAVFRMAAKVGLSLYPNDGMDADTLFKNAEAALKKAKARGERFLFYTQDMNKAVAGRLTLENQLRRALDNQEFILHYQPKVNLASGKLTSAEALIRWNDPQTGLVPPGRFIPILEETGMIYDVGRWALHQAVADCLRWRDAGLPALRLAVNVSPLQLRNRGFIDEIREAIGMDARAAAGLELEITESLIMEDIKHNIASLKAIRDLGITIAIDDFGTGFSSLSYLSRLPVDTLKIDRSFVIQMTVAREGLSLVSAIINLAHSLKLKVVAEGVETEEQSRLLRLLGCDEMQGFLFSKAVPSDVFEARFLASPPTG